MSNSPRCDGARHGGRRVASDSDAFASTWMRTLSITTGSSMQEMIGFAPPQTGQVWMSFPRSSLSRNAKTNPVGVRQLETSAVGELRTVEYRRCSARLWPGASKGNPGGVHADRRTARLRNDRSWPIAVATSIRPRVRYCRGHPDTRISPKVRYAPVAAMGSGRGAAKPCAAPMVSASRRWATDAPHKLRKPPQGRLICLFCDRSGNHLARREGPHPTPSGNCRVGCWTSAKTGSGSR